jgi:AraC family transcriptional activator of tynA and feaB
MLTDARFDRLSIGGVGLRIGLSDPSHFIRQCRKHLGMTPGELRRQRESWSVDLLSRSKVRIAAR